ncbi:MAG: rubredoxin [Desulforegulaceae bacterium]|nr:rubredoxin [Desulforegulaceae bacterium]
MKQWECTVCGYIHEGDEPPETCPVCGVGKSAFTLIEKKEAEKPEQEEKEETSEAKPESSEKLKETKPSSLKEKIDQAILDHHLHPITVHIPNGVIPVAVFLLLIGSLFGNESLITAAYYNISLVFIFMPVVLYTGYIEWINRYRKAMTGIFQAKLVSAAVVATLSCVLALWKSFSADAGGGFYLILHLIMLASAGIAGHIGGKFVFKN